MSFIYNCVREVYFIFVFLKKMLSGMNTDRNFRKKRVLKTLFFLNIDIY